ncbi:bifunctional phosphoserine phosphatase/homoserine phosphotransferase ThrH [Serratia fonticola]
MKTACIDMEGVLIPEMWPFLAKKTGLPSLSRTTREEPDYRKLVNDRINILYKNKLKLSDIVNEISDLPLLPGAFDFITQLKVSYRIILVSDAFYQMVLPFMKALGNLELKCHHFKCNEDGFIFGAEYSRLHGKVDVVNELRRNDGASKILAVGDAFNDLEMLISADKGFLFRPSTETAKAANNIKIVHTYKEILDEVNRVSV